MTSKQPNSSNEECLVYHPNWQEIRKFNNHIDFQINKILYPNNSKINGDFIECYFDECQKSNLSLKNYKYYPGYINYLNGQYRFTKFIGVVRCDISLSEIHLWMNGSFSKCENGIYSDFKKFTFPIVIKASEERIKFIQTNFYRLIETKDHPSYSGAYVSKTIWFNNKIPQLVSMYEIELPPYNDKTYKISQEQYNNLKYTCPPDCLINLKPISEHFELTKQEAIKALNVYQEKEIEKQKKELFTEFLQSIQHLKSVVEQNQKLHETYDINDNNEQSELCSKLTFLEELGNRQIKRTRKQ